MPQQLQSAVRLGKPGPPCDVPLLQRLLKSVPIDRFPADAMHARIDRKRIVRGGASPWNGSSGGGSNQVLSVSLQSALDPQNYHDLQLGN